MTDSRKAIGIDIGGTKMAVAAVDDMGRICARLSLPTEAEGGLARAVERLTQAVGAVTREAGCLPGELLGVGIGCTGPVDPLRGTIHNPYTLPGWDNCDILSPLREGLGLPAYLENDADAAALGECFAGAGRGFDPVVMLTFGTGIGGATVAGGQVFRGVAGGHPEIGHIPILSDDRLACYCGMAGCFESIASGTAIGAAGQRLGLAGSREVFAAAEHGDAGARAIVDRAIRATVAAVWTILHTVMPQRIIFGGGIMEAHYELFAGPTRDQIQRSTMVPPGHAQIARAVLGNDAGLVGAASLVFAAARTRTPQPIAT